MLFTNLLIYKVELYFTNNIASIIALCENDMS